MIEEHGSSASSSRRTADRDEDGVDIIRLATATGVRVAVLPRLLEVIGTSVEFDDLGGRLLLGVRSRPGAVVTRAQADLRPRRHDRAPDRARAAVAADRARREADPARSDRLPADAGGRHGREFQLLKFRTMVRDAEAQKDLLMEHNEAAPLFKIANDPRTTPLGRFLRRYALDELPQLFSVLRGDMSLVGPRPLITEEDRLFTGWQRRRYHVAPGITGPWQILGSSRVPVEDMLTLDYLYCSSWSLWLDAKILARTILYLLSRNSGEHKPDQR